MLRGDAGSYAVVVSNTLGSATSAPPATLTVIDPIITNQPASRTNYAGTMTMFRVGVLGTLPLSYQWFWNGTNALTTGVRISGALSPTLTISNLLGGDAGSYTVAVSNALGSATSTPSAVLMVIDPIVTTQPVEPNQRGGDPSPVQRRSLWHEPGYQWFKDGVAISGATRTVLTLTNVSDSDAGNYSARASTAFGSAMSSNATLAVVDVPNAANDGYSVAAGMTLMVPAPGCWGMTPLWERKG